MNLVQHAAHSLCSNSHHTLLPVVLALTVLDTSILLTTNALLSSAAALIMLVVLRTRKTYPGFAHWTLGVACLALGAGMLIPDLLPSNWASRVLRNAMLLGGQLLILRGLLIFRGYRISYWLEGALGLLFLTVFGLYSLDAGQLNARIVIYCLFSSALSFLTVGITMRQRPAYFGSNDVLLALWLSIYGVLSLVRIAHQLSDPRVSTAFEAMNGFGSLYAMAQILTVQLLTLTLISMNSQRIEYAYRQSEARLRESEALLRSIGDNLPDGFVYQYQVIDGKPHFNYVSAGVQRIFGLQPSDLMNNAQAFFDLVAPESLNQYMHDEAKSARELSVYSAELLLTPPERPQVWMHFRSRPQQRADGSVQWDGVAIDISKLKQAETALQHFKAIVESSDDAIISMTLNGQITSWNKGAEKIFGYSATETIGQFMHMLLPDDRKDEESTILARVARKESLDHFETVRQAKDHRLIDISATISPIFNDKGELIGASKIARDISAHKRAEHELELLSQTDSLTNLKNRRHFMKIADQELARSIRYNRPLSLLMIDLDHFKKVNDTYGHLAGDRVLQNLGAMCRESFREEDVVGRMGGEEFAVMLPETPLEKAMEVAERFRQTMADAAMAMDHGLPLHCALSVGVTTLVDSQTNLDTLLSQADKALYDAKNQGRNRVCCWKGLQRSNTSDAAVA